MRANFGFVVPAALWTASGLAAWTLWGYFSSRVEQATYAVVGSGEGYEVRLYPPRVVAQTAVSGPYQEALSQGFRIVAGYIFGGNAKKQKIAMTAPVVERAKGESIAMTAPVLADMDGEERTVAFGMPRSYALADLPTPTDPRVKLVEVPEKKMAALRFSGLRTQARVLAKKRELIDALARDGVATAGAPQYAGYNAPWTPAWMTRHEILIPLN